MLGFRSPHRAFTLVELLTVVGLLAVLVVLIVPSTGRLMTFVRQAKCLSNLKQIGAGVMLYAAEHNGEFPHVKTDDGAQPPTLKSTWIWDINPYVAAPQQNLATGADPCPPVRDSVFFCPAAIQKRSWKGSEPDYGANYRVFTWYSDGKYEPPLKPAMIRNLGQCLMLADCCQNGLITDGSWWLYLNEANLANISASFPPTGLAPRHGYDGKDARIGRFGTLFCDGHAEMFSYGDPRLLDADFRRDFFQLP